MLSKLKGLSKGLTSSACAALLLAVSAPAGAAILWVGDSNGDLGTVDTNTAAVVNIGNMGAVMTDIAFAPNGDLYAISFTDLYRINTTTGAATLIGPHGIGANNNSLVFSSTGVLYAANGTGLYTLNTGTGAGSIVGASGYASSGDLAFVGGQLYLSATGSPNRLVALNTATGVGSLVGSIGFADVYGLASPDGVNLFGLSGTSILTINTLTGLGTFLTAYSDATLGQAYGSAFYSEANPVPLPAAAWLLLSGLGGLGLIRRRKTTA